MVRLAINLRTARAWITSRTKAAGLVSLVILAGGGVLLLEGLVSGGLVAIALGVGSSWLTGLWTVPGSTDSYYRKVSRSAQSTQVNSQLRKNTLVAELQKSTQDLDQLVTRGRTGNRDQDIILECRELDKLIANNEASFEHISRVAEHRRRLLAGASAESAEDGFPRQELAHAFATRASLLEAMFVQDLRSAQEQIDKLGSIKPPTPLRIQHQQYVDTVRAYAQALNELQQALTQGSLSDDLIDRARGRLKEWRNLTVAYSDEMRSSWFKPTLQRGSN
jgi:hypothetical protein